MLGLPTSSFAPSKLDFESRQFVREMGAKGITFQGQFVNDWSKGIGDSSDSGLGFGRYSFDFTASIDNSKLLGWNGSSAAVRLKNHLGEFGYGYEQSFQVPSNIDASSRTTLYEMWIQQKLYGDRLRLKFGKVDANTEFSVLQNAGDFLNSSMGYSPTIMEFPSYPEPKLGFNAFLTARKNYSVGAGVFQTAGGGTFLVAEPGRKWSIGSKELDGHVSVGYWKLNETMTGFDGSQVSSAQGFYSVVEQSVWRKAVNENGGERKLSTFAQIATGNGRVNPLSSHLGAGAVLQAPSERRPGDAVGLAVTRVGFSSAPQAQFEHHSELVMETYYRASVSRHVALVPDIQFLHHPGGMTAHHDCALITPRLVISF